MNKLLKYIVVTTLFASLTTHVFAENIVIDITSHDGLFKKVFDAGLKRTQAKYPDKTIAINFKTVANFQQILAARLMTGESLGCIVSTEISWAGQLTQDNLFGKNFLDLTNHFSTEDKKQLLPGRLASYTMNDKIYMIETSTATGIYYYMPKVFEENGVKVPKTWDEFTLAGKELAKKGVAINVISDDQAMLFMQLMQKGIHIFNDKGEFILGDPAQRDQVLAGLQSWQDGVKEGSLVRLYGDALFSSSLVSLFKDHKVAGIMAPEWFGQFILKSLVPDMKQQWAIQPMPKWTAGKGYAAGSWGGTGFGIIKTCPYPDIAWDILNESLVTRQGQIDKMALIGFLPIRKDLLNDPIITELKDDYYTNEYPTKIIAEAALNAAPYQVGPSNIYVKEAAKAYMADFLDGKMTAAQFLDKLLKKVADDIDFNS